jgi:hypothetical protein
MALARGLSPEDAEDLGLVTVDTVTATISEAAAHARSLNPVEAADTQPDATGPRLTPRRQHIARIHRFLEEAGLRPKPVAENVVPDEEQPVITDQLLRRIKLHEIRDNPRARFLPNTNTETDEVIKLIRGHLDEPTGALGRINAVYQASFAGVRLARQHGPIDLSPNQAGFAAVKDIAFEYDDYRAQATLQRQALSDINWHIMNGREPSLTLAQAFGGADFQLGLSLLVRYLDLVAFCDSGMHPGFDPLLTHEDRGPQYVTGKNKTIQDPYTTTNQSPQVAEYIATRINRLTVANVRSISPAALADQRSRASFWEERCKEIKRHFIACQALELINAYAS